MAETPLVFIGHAPSDADYLQELLMHLRPLEERKVIRVFHEGCVSVGENVEMTALAHQHSAALVVLLVSADLLASRMHIVRRAERLQQLSGLTIIPVLLRSVCLNGTILEDLKSVPSSGGWASTQSDRDRMWAELITLLEEQLARQAYAAMPIAAAADLRPVPVHAPPDRRQRGRPNSLLAGPGLFAALAIALAAMGILALGPQRLWRWAETSGVQTEKQLEDDCLQGQATACVSMAGKTDGNRSNRFLWRACEQLITRKSNCQEDTCIQAGVAACMTIGDLFSVCRSCRGDCPECAECWPFAVSDGRGSTGQAWKERAAEFYRRACSNSHRAGCVKADRVLLPDKFSDGLELCLPPGPAAHP